MSDWINDSINDHGFSRMLDVGRKMFGNSYSYTKNNNPVKDFFYSSKGGNTVMGGFTLGCVFAGILHTLGRPSKEKFRW